MMDYSKLYGQAATMAANAKNGTLTVAGVKYALTFKPEWCYEVVDPNGEVITRFNTKKLTIARQWLREYLAN